MSETHETFVDMALRGDVLMEEIDDFVDAWHGGGTGKKLHEFLGMTREEYSLWLTYPGALGLILAGRKMGRRLEDVANDNLQTMRIAARGEFTSKLRTLQRWLDRQRNVDRAAP